MSGFRGTGWFALAMSIVVMVGGIACGETYIAEPDCIIDADCGERERCDMAIGVCVEDRSPTDDQIPDNQSGNSQTNNQTGNNQTGNSQTNNQTGNNQTSPCTQELDDCDPSQVDQGAFLCVENDEGGGTCYAKCNDAGTPDACGAGRYCWQFTDLPSPICLASQCNAHPDCSGGTCIDLDNQFSFCVEAGPLVEGQSCTNADGAEACQTGLYCDGPTGGVGQCRQVCDPWAFNPCGSGQYCRNFWTRSGLCTPDQATDPFGGLAQTYDECSPAGYWCDDSVRCFALDSANICLKYCRPGYSDCPPYGFDPSVCDPYIILPGSDSLGICMPACSSHADCGDGFDCVGQICRQSCWSASDCCPPEDPDCGAICESNGYCA